MCKNVQYLQKRCIYVLYIYECSVCLYACMPERASDLILDVCEPTCGFWELNSELLEEQPGLNF